jgi:hypothetical protein
MKKLLAAFALISLLASCATLPTIGDAALPYMVTQTEVLFEPGSKVRWQTGGAEYARSLGIVGPRQYDPLESSSSTPDPFFTAIESEEGIAYTREAFSRRTEPLLFAATANTLPGNKPAKVVLRIYNLYVVAPGEKVFVNSANQITGTVSLVDAANGATVSSRPLGVLATTRAGGLTSLALDLAAGGKDRQYDVLIGALNQDISTWLKSANKK